jgi:CelD/BcsL family acetyltransferase involved in cellulose biosynthesis
MPLTVDWVGEESEFEALAGEWDALAAADSVPFDLHCWYATWWRAFGAGQELAICAARRDGALVGVFPLCRTGNGELKAMANTHTPLFRPLASDEEARAAIVAAAMENGSDLELTCLPEGDASVARLREGARAAAKTPLIEPSYTSPTVDTSGDFDAWRELSKPRWGAPLERFRRKMGRDHEAELEIVEPPRELEAELVDGYRVEASGWKGEAGTAILSSPRTEAFYTEIARVFDAREELRFSRIVLDGETAAFDFTLLHGGRLYLLKTGYDERFRRLAPGLVMRLSVIERCFETGARSHELLGDESGWKSKFATGSRSYVTLHAYRRNPVGLARYAYRGRIRPRLKDAYRRLRPSLVWVPVGCGILESTRSI